MCFGRLGVASPFPAKPQRMDTISRRPAACSRMMLANRIGVATTMPDLSAVTVIGWEKATTSSHVASCVNFPHIAALHQSTTLPKT